MAFYSSLELVANRDVRGIAREAVAELLLELGIRGELFAKTIWTLSPDLIDAFEDEEAREENGSFFVPDSVSVSERIQVSDLEDHYTGKGWSVSLHGNGYLWPRTVGDFGERIRGLQKLLRLREEMERRFGGRFAFPRKDAFLRRRLVEGGEGWMWFASESF